MPLSGNLVPRHKIVAFYGVPNSSGQGHSLTRMKFFTELSMSKNPEEYERKYVDEATKRTDIVAYAPSVGYAFDKHRNDPVLNDIIDITDSEKLGADAVRVIAWIDTDTGKGYQREYSVVPDSEGGDENAYTYSGTLKACGELSEETTYTSINNWQGAEVST